MSVMIAMLRGVNVAGNHMVKMETLRAVCAALGCTEVQTLLQSGNVVFQSGQTKTGSKPAGSSVSAKTSAQLAVYLEDAIEAEFGFRVPVVLRSAAELRAVVEADPFPGEAQAEPGKVLVTFLYGVPSAAQLQTVRAMSIAPEQMWVGEREIVTYYPAGAGLSKLRWGPIDKALGTSGTARNWNTTTKLLAMAEAMER